MVPPDARWSARGARGTLGAMKRRIDMNRTLAFVLVAVLAGGVAGGIVALATDGDSAPASTGSAPPAVASDSADVSSAAQLYRRDAPGVVVITATQTEKVPPTFFAPSSKQQVKSLGSGFVIDRQGDIVTNDHVVAGASGIRVGFSGGATYPASVVGTDPASDLAVVRVQAPASALHPLSFDDSSLATPGDPVYAIGNPFGLDRTMTAGIVSATGRDIQAPDGLTIPKAIQTDAPINHGNSGGPLLDARGNVIGVNSQIQGGTVDANVGVGFAIPSDTTQSVAHQLIANGHVAHPWLGVQVETIDGGAAKAVRGLPSHGVVVTKVSSNGPADKAGLRPATSEATVNGVSVPFGGDAIVAVDGKTIDTSTQLATAIAARKPGDQVKLEIVRGGATRTVTVTVGAAPQQS
jgi:S1-C subfamily serine protease